jgi:hypothetical protein
MDYYYLRLARRCLLPLVAVVVGTTLAFSGLSQGGISTGALQRRLSLDYRSSANVDIDGLDRHSDMRGT